MNDNTTETEVIKAETELKTIWHEIEAFFEKLAGHVSAEDANKTKVLGTFKAATHELMGTTAPADAAAAEPVSPAPAPAPEPEVAATVESAAEPVID